MASAQEDPFRTAQDNTRGPGGICWYRLLNGQLTADQRQSLDDALDNPAIYGTTIADVLADWTGRRVSSGNIQRHRNRRCICGR